MFLILISIALIVSSARAYNLDLVTAQLYKSPEKNPSWRSDYFGYSVALYTSRQGNAILVGAPRANSSRKYDRLEGIREAGAVYHCPVDGPIDSCTEWLIDDVRRILVFESPLRGRPEKDHGWLGANIQVNKGLDGKVAVCAPRWKIVTDTSYMNGMCYSVSLPLKNPLAFNETKVTRYFPLIDERKQIITLPSGNHYHYAMGLAGFSSHMTPDHGQLAIGAPGVLRDLGSAILLPQERLINNVNVNSYSAIIPYIPREWNLDYNSYFGYSITSGNFYRPNERLYAAGAPRSYYTIGNVYIYSYPRRSEDTIIYRKMFSGTQVGEYFGASLTACDVNGDGRDDLIVGAPQWFKNVDEGRIYAYVSYDGDFDVQTIDGKFEGARFGTSITCLGDLDKDGYGDIAVGAPYEDNRGSVYIFNGGSAGLEKQPSQRIRASDLSTSLRGFGIAISEPRDLDGNMYSDVAVGSYLSGHVAVLKSKPVIALEIQVKPAKNFTLTENSTNFFVEVCSWFDGAYAPETLNVTQSLQLDSDHKRVIIYKERLYVKDYSFVSILKRGERKCTSVMIRLKVNIQNMIDPIEIGAEATINDGTCTLCPTINPRLSTTKSNLKLAFVLDCGIDNICTSDLRANISSDLGSNSSYVIGSKGNVNITVYVENHFEPAYRTEAHIFIPESIALARIPPQCDEQSQSNGTSEVVCSVGNPLRYNNTIIMELDMTAIKYNDKFKEILVVVTTQSKEKNAFDNIADLKINFDIDADIAIIGKSNEDLYSYYKKDEDDEKLNKFTFNHIYEVQKFGVTPIQQAVLMVNIPSYWKNMKIARLNQMQGFIDGQRYSCENVTLKEKNSSFSTYHNRSFYEGNSTLIIPSEKRTIYINCTDSDVTCQKFRCELGPFIKSQSVAKLTLAIDFYLSNITAKITKEKDIIFFVSEGFIEITQPNITIELVNKRPFYKQISTTFLSNHDPEKVAIWIIILSVLVGVVVLTILCFLLFKLGFFKRKRKEDLATLRSNEEVNLNDGGNENSGATSESADY